MGVVGVASAWAKPRIGATRAVPAAAAMATKVRLRINMQAPVESLNVGVAASLVLFEIARQRCRESGVGSRESGVGRYLKVDVAFAFVKSGTYGVSHPV